MQVGWLWVEWLAQGFSMWVLAGTALAELLWLEGPVLGPPDKCRLGLCWHSSHEVEGCSSRVFGVGPSRGHTKRVIMGGRAGSRGLLGGQCPRSAHIEAGLRRG